MSYFTTKTMCMIAMPLGNQESHDEVEAIEESEMRGKVLSL